MRELKVRKGRRGERIKPERTVHEVDVVPSYPNDQIKEDYRKYPMAYQSPQIDDLKERLRDPMIFGDGVSPFWDEAMTAIRQDMEDTRAIDDPEANQFRAAILFDGDPLHAGSLVRTAGMFHAKDERDMLCKIATKEEPGETGVICSYTPLPDMPMLFGNVDCASGVFVPFSVSKLGLHNAHIMLDAFCGPIPQVLCNYGMNPMDIFEILGRMNPQYPGDGKMLYAIGESSDE